ncbi:MAG: hypothetical protein CL759_06940 [Chloroflexi bacterium]|nr:hypothetical protein [Chloroflexota bacterium]|tara:strand:- start:904 stop:1695 length:792 start_codon:yes stop_codon:yes gene_type:complete
MALDPRISKGKGLFSDPDDPDDAPLDGKSATERSLASYQPEWYDDYTKAAMQRRNRAVIDHARSAYDRRVAGEGSVARVAQQRNLGGAYDRAARLAASNPMGAQQGAFTASRAGAGVIGSASMGREREIGQARAMASDAYARQMANQLEAQRLQEARRVAAINETLAARARQMQMDEWQNAQQQALIQGYVNAGTTLLGQAARMPSGDTMAQEQANYDKFFDQATADFSADKSGIDYSDTESIGYDPYGANFGDPHNSYYGPY